MFYLQIQADIIEYSTLKFKVAVQELLKRHGNVSTVELQWLEHPWNHEISDGKFELMNVDHCARSGGIIRIYFLFFLT